MWEAESLPLGASFPRALTMLVACSLILIQTITAAEATYRLPIYTTESMFNAAGTNNTACADRARPREASRMRPCLPASTEEQSEGGEAHAHRPPDDGRSARSITCLPLV